MTDGARIRLATHIDYIRRETGVADPAGELLLDVLEQLRSSTRRSSAGSRPPNRTITIAEVSGEEAFERLDWLNQ